MRQPVIAWAQSFPLGERAVQVAGDGAAQLRDLDILVVVGVLQVGGEVLPQSALAGLGDHGFLPRALKQAARISVRERTASSIAARFGPASTAFGATAWSASRTWASPARICATASWSTVGRRDRRGGSAPDQALVMKAEVESPDA